MTQHVANDLKAKMGESRAVQMAVGIVQNWAAGHDGKGGKVSASTQAAAQKAVAEWEALKARAGGGKGKSAGKSVEAAELTVAPPAVSLEDLAEMARHAGDRLAMLERLDLPATGRTAQFDALLVEAGAAGKGAGAPVHRTAAPGRNISGAPNASFETLHPRGGKGSPTGGKFIAKGSSGTEVRAVQRRVGARVDGQFGNQTKAAVEQFQRQHGLQVDGIIGRQTLAAFRGRKDAKRVKVGALSAADRSFLTGHVRGRGRAAGQQQTQTRSTTPGGRQKTVTKTTTPAGRTKTVTTLVEAVAATDFLDRVKGLELGELARLPDGGAVKHHASEDGRKQWTPGTPSRYSDSGMSWGTAYRTADEAVADALTRSAGSTDPAALGGPTRYSSYGRVSVAGAPARFEAVTPNGRPIVRFDGKGDPIEVAWPDITPAPALLD